MLGFKEENYYTTNESFPLPFSLAHSCLLNHFCGRPRCCSSDILMPVICTFSGKEGPLKIELVRSVPNFTQIDNYSPCFSLFIFLQWNYPNPLGKSIYPIYPIHVQDVSPLPANWLYEIYSIFTYTPLSAYFFSWDSWPPGLALPQSRHPIPFGHTRSVWEVRLRL